MKENNLLIFLVAATIILNVVFFVVGGSSNGTPIDQEKLVEDISTKLSTELASVTAINAAGNQNLLEEIQSIQAKDTKISVRDDKKALAHELALEEIQDDDFLEKVFDELRDYGIDIDDEDDIRLVPKDFDYDETEVSVYGEHAEVVIEINAYYIIDSDDEECGKARIQAEIEIDELDRDENYEDAEVDSYSIDVERNYGIDDRYCSA